MAADLHKIIITVINSQRRFCQDELSIQMIQREVPIFFLQSDFLTSSWLGKFPMPQGELVAPLKQFLVMMRHRPNTY